LKKSAEVRWEEDRALVKRCLEGSRDDWEKLVRRYRRLIYSIPVAYHMPPDQSDEIFQNVSVKLLENLKKLRRVEGLASWLVVTARRECTAYLRHSARWETLDESSDPGETNDPPDIAQTLVMVESEHALALALESIGDPCRSLLAALYLEDPTPSYKEIAGRLGKPVGSLGPTRNRCFSRLRKLYRGHGGSAPWSTSEKAT